MKTIIGGTAGLSRDLIFHPGETLREILDDRGMSQKELSQRTGVRESYISNIINGKKNISATFAKKMEYALGIESSFWINLQANYDKEVYYMKGYYCATCNKNVTTGIKVKKESFNVKGQKIFIKSIIRFCTNCKSEILDEQLDNENLKRLYDKYKRKNHLLTSQQISDIRNKLGLSQIEFANKLGLDKNTISHLENGCLQSNELDQFIRNSLCNCTDILSKYTSEQVAKWFLTYNNIRIVNDGASRITNLKLQKLLYYAQGTYMAIMDKKLFNDPILAWRYGPTIERIYYMYRTNKNDGISFNEDFDLSSFDDETNAILEDVYNTFGQFSTWKLNEMSCNELPWKDTVQGKEINPDIIKKYFVENYI